MKPIDTDFNQIVRLGLWETAEIKSSERCYTLYINRAVISGIELSWEYPRNIWHDNYILGWK